VCCEVILHGHSMVLVPLRVCKRTAPTNCTVLQTMLQGHNQGLQLDYCTENHFHSLTASHIYCSFCLLIMYIFIAAAAAVTELIISFVLRFVDAAVVHRCVGYDSHQHMLCGLLMIPTAPLYNPERLVLKDGTGASNSNFEIHASDIACQPAHLETCGWR
jgi:hypothetical protein